MINEKIIQGVLSQAFVTSSYSSNIKQPPRNTQDFIENFLKSKEKRQFNEVLSSLEPRFKAHVLNSISIALMH
jgi:hypothetical protein